MMGQVPSRQALTLLVHCDLDAATAARTALAVDLARRTGARLIGVAAGDAEARRRRSAARCGGRVRGALRRAAEDFKTRAAEVERANFRCAIKPADVFLAEQAVSADLVIVGPQGSGEPGSPLSLDTAALVMCTGRPVLIAPEGLDRLDLRRVVVGWKKAREARRVLLDCLPWLAMAEDVLILHIIEQPDERPEDDGLDAVRDWLSSRRGAGRGRAQACAPGTGLGGGRHPGRRRLLRRRPGRRRRLQPRPTYRAAVRRRHPRVPETGPPSPAAEPLECGRAKAASDGRRRPHRLRSRTFGRSSGCELRSHTRNESTRGHERNVVVGRSCAGGAERRGLAGLVRRLAVARLSLIGPTVRDRAIVYDDIASVADLPRGWTDEQDGGRYRLERRDDDALFGYAVGPHSWKRFLHPPVQRLWRARARRRQASA